MNYEYKTLYIPKCADLNRHVPKGWRLVTAYPVIGRIGDSIENLAIVIERPINKETK